MSSLLDSPFILANDPEAEEILVVVGGLEGSVLTRRHSWISPRFNAQILLLPLCLGTVEKGLRSRVPEAFLGGVHLEASNEGLGGAQVPRAWDRSTPHLPDPP